jgi:hypothetical protein
MSLRGWVVMSMQNSGSIIVDDDLGDIKDELLKKGSYHNREKGGFHCPKCLAVVEGTGHPDPCLGALFGLADEAERGKARAKGPRVRYACCGHGKDYGYIVFENGVVVISKIGFEVEYG